jgi:hypothetical protein
MKMIQVLCVGSEWKDYCNVGILTDIKDSDGNLLSTGDIVRIVDVKTYACVNQTKLCGEAVVVFDQFGRFLSTNKFYVEGWISIDFNSEDCPYILVKQNRSFRIKGNLKIIKSGE